MSQCYWSREQFEAHVLMVFGRESPVERARLAGYCGA